MDEEDGKGCRQFWLAFIVTFVVFLSLITTQQPHNIRASQTRIMNLIRRFISYDFIVVSNTNTQLRADSNTNNLTCTEA